MFLAIAASEVESYGMQTKSLESKFAEVISLNFSFSFRVESKQRFFLIFINLS